MVVNCPIGITAVIATSLSSFYLTFIINLLSTVAIPPFKLSNILLVAIAILNIFSTAKILLLYRKFHLLYLLSVTSTIAALSCPFYLALRKDSL